MPELTPTTVSLAAIGALLLLFAVSLARSIWRRYRTDEDAHVAALPPEPLDDSCVTDGCGHARGAHYQRSDRSRGACLDPTCLCGNYRPDRPTPVPVPVSHNE